VAPVHVQLVDNHAISNSQHMQACGLLSHAARGRNPCAMPHRGCPCRRTRAPSGPESERVRECESEKVTARGLGQTKTAVPRYL